MNALFLLVGAWSLYPRAADGTMLRASSIEELRGFLRQGESKWYGDGEKCLMRSFTICIHLITLGC
jgi:hypothetical protein